VLVFISGKSTIYKQLTLTLNQQQRTQLQTSYTFK